jgi:cation transport ATPase
METATVIILTAGTMTFANEWYQTKEVNWKVPIATLLLAAAFDGLSHIDSEVSTMLAVMVLIGAALTEFNGKSAVSTISSIFSTKAATPKVQVT